MVRKLINIRNGDNKMVDLKKIQKEIYQIM